jgi:hypothetical protein
MSCLASLPAASADAASPDGRALQILILRRASRRSMLYGKCSDRRDTVPAIRSLQRVDRRIGTLCRNLRDHFLPCSLHHVLSALEMRPETPRPAHLIDQDNALQAKFSGCAFRPPIRPNQLRQACAESELRSKSRRVGAARDVMTVPNEKAVWPGTDLF